MLCAFRLAQVDIASEEGFNVVSQTDAPDSEYYQIKRVGEIPYYAYWDAMSIVVSRADPRVYPKALVPNLGRGYVGIEKIRCAAALAPGTVIPSPVAVRLLEAFVHLRDLDDI